MPRNWLSASGGGATPAASNARETSSAAPSPIIWAMALSGNGRAPHDSSSRFAESAISRSESTRVPSKSKTKRRNMRFEDVRILRMWGCENLQACSSDPQILQFTVLGEGSRRLPHFDADDRESLCHGVIEDQPRDA